MNKINTKTGRIIAHLEAWLIDHEILRVFYRNFFKLSDQAFRSNHPSPRFIRKLHKKYGLKTIISMRAADKTGQYQLEKEACEQLGIQLINHKMSSSSFPDAEDVLEAKKILQTAKTPLLIHCKSGADRAGLMSVFYKHFVEGEPIREAVKQLSMKYGHFRWAETGKLDVFFDEFLKFEKAHPEVTFEEWVKHHYDKQALNQQFHAKGWANIVVNKILHRE